MPSFIARFVSPLVTWWQRRQSPARKGERIARDHLRKQGHRILAQNMLVGKQEIDILAQTEDGRAIIVCEVKTTVIQKSGDERIASGMAALRVDRQKQNHLVRAAHRLQKRRNFRDKAFRFDVITVVLQEGQPPVVKHIPGAFESRY